MNRLEEYFILSKSFIPLFALLVVVALVSCVTFGQYPGRVIQHVYHYDTYDEYRVGIEPHDGLIHPIGHHWYFVEAVPFPGGLAFRHSQPLFHQTHRFISEMGLHYPDPDSEVWVVVSAEEELDNQLAELEPGQPFDLENLPADDMWLVWDPENASDLKHVRFDHSSSPGD